MKDMKTLTKELQAQITHQKALDNTYLNKHTSVEHKVIFFCKNI